MCARPAALTSKVFTPIFFSQLFFVSKGIDADLVRDTARPLADADAQAFYSLSILNAGSVVGRVLPNFISDFIVRTRAGHSTDKARDR